MGIQRITATPPTTATLTLTVRATTDLEGHSTGPTGGTDAPTMRDPTMAAGAIAAPMLAHTAGVIAAHTGGEVGEEDGRQAKAGEVRGLRAASAALSLTLHERLSVPRLLNDLGAAQRECSD